VRFENREVRASFEQGRMLDSDLVHVSVHIPDLARVVAVAIRGRAEGSFSDGLRVLGESPLRKRFGALATTFEAQGDMGLDLDLKVPLRYQGRKSPFRFRKGVGYTQFHALQRRLALDLGDLFGTGYAFEKIFGQITIGNGSATITELLIEGPAADISISGGANLVARELDQTATVYAERGYRRGHCRGRSGRALGRGDYAPRRPDIRRSGRQVGPSPVPSQGGLGACPRSAASHGLLARYADHGLGIEVPGARTGLRRESVSG